MRDFLQDAIDHQDAGIGRAEKQARPDLPKRFYTEAAVRPEGDGFAVTLDGRPTKTPGQVRIVVPAAMLADRLASEWGAQGKDIDALTMPHVRLVNSALEGGDAARPALVDEVVKYAGNDLLLYRADTPVELVRKQEEHWDAALVALARHFGVSFVPTVGILHQPQSDETLGRLRAAVSDIDLLTAAALVSITGLTGSGLLAIALHAELIDRDAAWAAAHVDEDYQISLWGEDYEAARRREQRRKEYDAAVNVVEWLRGSPPVSGG